MLIEMYVYIQEERERYEIIQGVLGKGINFVYFQLIFKFLIDFFKIFLRSMFKKINRNNLYF